jgi:hypothetical protein
MCEVHTITCPIPRTRPLEWVSNSVKLVHIHKSKLPNDSLNIGDTQPWTNTTNHPQPTKQTTLGQPTNQLIPLDGAGIASGINLSSAHIGSSGSTKYKG